MATTCDWVCSRTLNRRVTVQTVTSARDGYGQPIETWANGAKIYVAIKQLSGTELVNAKQVSGEVTHLVRLRYRTDVGITNRLLYGDKVFGILNVNDVEEAHKETQLLCKEIV